MPTPTPAGSCWASSARATGSRSSACATASSPVRSTGAGRAELPIAPQAGERPRLLGRLGPRRERPLPEADAAPFAELEADLAVKTGPGEAERLVKAHARVVGQGDGGDRLGEALRLEQRDQRRVEGAADAAALRALGEVDCGLDREAIGAAGAESRRIGVAEEAVALVAGDEPGMERAARFDPAPDLGLVGRLGLERDRALRHI